MILAGVFSLLCGATFAATQKIGVVDINKVMAGSKEAVTIKKNLEGKYRPREQALMKMQKSIQEDMQKFQRDTTVMTDAQKKNLQEKIIKARKEFETKGRAFQQEVNTAQGQAMQKLFSKVKGVVDNVAKTQHYDIIIQKDAVQYIASKDDITQKVIDKLN